MIMKVQFARYFCEDQLCIDLLRGEHPGWSEAKGAAEQLRRELQEQGVTAEIDVASYYDHRPSNKDIYTLVGTVNVGSDRLQQAFANGVAGMWDVMDDLSRMQCKERSTEDSHTNQWICQLRAGHGGPHRWPDQAYEPGEQYGPAVDRPIFHEHRISIAKASDSDVVLRFPSGKEITIQVRYSNGDVNYEGSLDIILPKPTLVTNWVGVDMEPAQAPNPERQHERTGSQLVLEIP